MQHDDGAEDATHLAPVIDLFGARRSKGEKSRDSAPSSSAQQVQAPDPAATSWESARPAPSREVDDDPIARVKALGDQLEAEADARRQAVKDSLLKRPPRRAKPIAEAPEVDNEGWWVDGADDPSAKGDDSASAVTGSGVSDSRFAASSSTASTSTENTAAEGARSPSVSRSREVDSAPTRATAAAKSRWVATVDNSESDDDDKAAVPRLPIEEASTWALARRGLSVSKMRQKLTEKGYLEDLIETEIERLLKARYLDDARLAEEIVRVEFERKGKGRSVVTTELRRRGIDADDYTAALDDIDAELELDRAADIAYRKMSSSFGLDSRTAERRLSALLARRGYSGDLARAAIARATQRHADGD